ncbi:MAG: hypothetical protein ACUVRE_05930 [Thermoanaerobaculaceae bacterium]
MRRSPELVASAETPGWGFRDPITWSLFDAEDNAFCPYVAILSGAPAKVVCFDWQFVPVNEASLPLEQVTGLQAVGEGEERLLWVLGGVHWGEEVAAQKPALTVEVKGKRGAESLLLASREVGEQFLRRLGSSRQRPLKPKEILLLPLGERWPQSPVGLGAQVEVEEGPDQRSWRHVSAQLGRKGLILGDVLPVVVREWTPLNKELEFAKDTGEVRVSPGTTIVATNVFSGKPGEVSVVFELAIPIPEEGQGVASAALVLAQVVGRSVSRVDWIDIKGGTTGSQNRPVNGTPLLVFHRLLGTGKKALVFASRLKKRNCWT